MYILFCHTSRSAECIPTIRYGQSRRHDSRIVGLWLALALAASGSDASGSLRSSRKHQSQQPPYQYGGSLTYGHIRLSVNSWAVLIRIGLTLALVSNARRLTLRDGQILFVISLGQVLYKKEVP